MRQLGVHADVVLALSLVTCLSAVTTAENSPERVLHAYAGSTPVIDGVIEPGEWEDAESWSGIQYFDPQFQPVNDSVLPIDLQMVDIFVKHDNTSLYFAFVIQDDTLYGIDTDEWTPSGNPGANNLTRTGWPWFGDEVELLLNPGLGWLTSPANQTAVGDATSWQMVCNLHKSRLGGIGIGGLLEGEPRSNITAWNTYQHWILSGDMVAGVKAFHGQQPPLGHHRQLGSEASTATAVSSSPTNGSYYVFEWGVKFNPCIQIGPDAQYYNPLQAGSGLNQAILVGMNIAVGDVDQEAQGDPTYGLRHEMWFNGTKGQCSGLSGNCHTLLSEFGWLWLEPGPKPAR